MPPLRRDDLAADPIAQLADWYQRALDEVPLADARMVLLKGFSDDGLRFFTNYESVKAGQLEAAGHAAVIVYWRELDRQVRARGPVRRLTEADSEAYFATRPRDSQLGAWASPQSSPIESREELDARVGELGARFGGGEVPRPEHWGGYVLRPETVEFWQGQVGRLHDRFRYSREGQGWRIERLAP